MLTCRWLAAASSRDFWSSSASAPRQLSGSLLDLMLETRVRRLEPFGHLIELLGERSELVPARHVDPLIERTGAGSSRQPPGSTRSAWRALGARRTLVTTATTRNTSSSSAVRQIADSMRANAWLVGSSTKTHQPGASTRRERAEHFAPLGSRPVVTTPASSAVVPVRAALTCGSAAKLVCREDEVDVGMCDEIALRVNCVRVTGSSDPRPVDGVHDGFQVDVGHDDALPRGMLGNHNRHVGPRTQSGKVTSPKYRRPAFAAMNSGRSERSP